MAASIITILLIGFMVWLVYEAWRAPQYRQDLDGKYHQLSEPKKLKDLFKFKK